MNLKQLIMTENACYKAGKTIDVKGLFVHSTGANNPWLKRYVGPDDGLLGENKYNNHWNAYHPDGREICVHAFIGKLADGSVATYQTLPWDHRGWHAGGSANNSYIGFEICEDDLTDENYFNAVYKEAVELCVYLCKEFDLTENDIICHSEGHALGIASNHGDVMHWFPKFGKSMDTFRADVKALIEGEVSGEKSITPFKVGDIVKVKETATTYYPGSKTIPNWVKSDFVHVIKQIETKGQPTFRGKKIAVLLGDKIINGKTRNTREDGVNSWIDIDNLELVEGVDNIEEDTEEEQEIPQTIDPKIYTVVKGDSLWSIAKKELGSGAKYPHIKTANNLKTNVIHVGDRLIIPNIYP